MSNAPLVMAPMVMFRHGHGPEPQTLRVTVYRHDFNGMPEWTVTTVLNNVSHYDAQDALKGMFENVVFDSEMGQFFAYAPNRTEASLLAQALVQVDRQGLPTEHLEVEWEDFNE